MSSLDLARASKKNHHDVVKIINKIKDSDFKRKNFKTTTYKDSYFRKQKNIVFTKKGFIFLELKMLNINAKFKGKYNGDI